MRDDATGHIGSSYGSIQVLQFDVSGDAIHLHITAVHAFQLQRTGVWNTNEEVAGSTRRAVNANRVALLLNREPVARRLDALHALRSVRRLGRSRAFTAAGGFDRDLLP